MTYYGRWTYKYEEAARRGAAGRDDRPRDRARLLRLGDGQELRTPTPCSTSSGQNPAAEHTPLESWIQRDTAVAAVPRRRARFRSRPSRPPSAATSSRSTSRRRSTPTSTPRPRRSPRTMSPASCPAPKRPDETVIYTAHHDHLGIGQPDANGDRIYNGAVDNGTGIAHLIEQARAFARRPADPALGRVPGRRRRGKGPARLRILCRQPALPARQDGRGAQHRRRWAPGAAPAISASAAAPGSSCSTCWSPKASKQGRSFTPDPTPAPAASSAPTISRSPRPAFRRFRFTPGNDLVNGGVARGEALSSRIYRQALPPAGRRV